jgi:hypothetical protein
VSRKDDPNTTALVLPTNDNAAMAWAVRVIAGHLSRPRPIELYRLVGRLVEEA